jgi:hypothetical protein
VTDQYDVNNATLQGNAGQYLKKDSKGIGTSRKGIGANQARKTD